MSEGETTLSSTFVALSLLDEAADVDRAAPRTISTADRVREAILSGEIAPGERINEVHLSRALGVSRTPTRAALHSLAAEGLVDYAHNRGFSVREFPLEAVLDALEIRATLEGLGCRFAAERGLLDEHHRIIQEALRKGDAILDNEKLTDADLSAYRAVNVAIYDTIMGAARNRMLAEGVRMTMNMPGAAHRHIVSFTRRDVRRRHDDHHRIYELIASGDGWRAELLMREHVISIKSQLLAYQSSDRRQSAESVTLPEQGAAAPLHQTSD